MLKIKTQKFNPQDIDQLIKMHSKKHGFASVCTYDPVLKLNYEYLLLEPIEIIKISELEEQALSELQNKYFSRLEEINFELKIPIAFLALAYEAFNFIEKIPRHPNNINFPDLTLVIYSRVVQIKPEGLEFTIDWGSPSLWSQFPENLCEIVKNVDQSQAITKMEFSSAEYKSNIKEIQNLISLGEIYQLNFTQRFTANFNDDPWDFYQELLKINPGNYSCFFCTDETYVISNSPELFLDYDKNIIRTSPIKGTVKRGQSNAEDETLINLLKNSIKDNSELSMIVDLERNDLGKISEIGSVEVTTAIRVESLKQIHHLVADIQGKVKQSYSNILRSLFPTGSITGAPKIASMNYIYKYEKSARGIYTGILGLFFTNHSCRFNVAIRTAVIKNQEITFGAGGGIVYDSDPNAEYDEMLLKAKAMLLALDRNKQK